MVSPDQAKACGQFQDFGLLEQWKKWKDFKQESNLLSGYKVSVMKE